MTGRRKKSQGEPVWNVIRLVLLSIITVMWVTNWLMGLASKSGLIHTNFEPDPTVNAVFTLVAGVVFASKQKIGKSDDDDHAE